ncbi:FAD-dependent monooxygenase [Pedobacter miscanthi]|uniref:FAD-binding monooxygenase n=1 Tax=Pedobacter miscanthi TaxID=2259170 RepID=A0A366KP92_9SPHI|nr:FAD-dependent monooxygenase [Pedobacter miscanthi]RBQ03083.1 FAD-binding monooxygenase [Pedobacter miscanthi]
MEQIKKSVLISGASFAGLTTAYWMIRLGYKVTIVEIGPSLKKGGTPVDIKDNTIEIVKRMGLFEQIKSRRVGPEKWEFKNAADQTGYELILKDPQRGFSDEEFEIERDDLLDMIYKLAKNDVEFIFNNSIIAMEENADCIKVNFKDGSSALFSFVFGCDGIHSVVRRIWFGHEVEYSHFLGQYFSIAVIDKLLVENGTYQMYAEPNKGAALYAHNNKTDLIFTFRPEGEIKYDFRDQQQLKDIVSTQMKGMGWRTAELENELLQSSSFYFDKFCQIKMPSWTKGRVALIGDAGYCASPAAGMGGSLAIIGATALCDAFALNNEDYQTAFYTYQNGLRPFVDEIQETAIQTLNKLLPYNEQEALEMWKHGISF